VKARPVKAGVNPPGTIIQNLPSTARVAVGGFGFLALIQVFEVLAEHNSWQRQVSAKNNQRDQSYPIAIAAFHRHASKR
jgi:hypothetical protein